MQELLTYAGFFAIGVGLGIILGIIAAKIQAQKTERLWKEGLAAVTGMTNKITDEYGAAMKLLRRITVHRDGKGDHLLLFGDNGVAGSGIVPLTDREADKWRGFEREVKKAFERYHLLKEDFLKAFPERCGKE